MQMTNRDIADRQHFYLVLWVKSVLYVICVTRSALAVGLQYYALFLIRAFVERCLARAVSYCNDEPYVA